MSCYTFDELDLMSVEDLERIIDEDAQKPVNEQLDEETLLYILHLIDSSGAYKNEFSDIEKARETFYQVYNPITSEKTKRFSNVIRNSKVFRTACAVIVLAAFFCSGMITAEASRYGHLKSKIRLTDETFSFSGIESTVYGIPAAGDFDTLPVLQPYQDILRGLSNQMDVMVTYLPGRYYVMEYTYKEGLQSFEIKIELYKQWEPKEPHIILWYNEPQYTGKGYEYPKDPGRPEEYITNGITHYLMTNNGLWQALWTNGTIECCISGIESKNELIKMIDSIYVRDTSVDALYDLGD